MDTTLRRRAVSALCAGGCLCMLSAWAANASEAGSIRIDFDPMRPALQAAEAAPAAASGAQTAAAPAERSLPLLRIIRADAGGIQRALVDDTWVRRGDVVAGWRVSRLRADSVDLVDASEPTQRLTLRLNQVDVRHHAAVMPMNTPTVASEKNP